MGQHLGRYLATQGLEIYGLDRSSQAADWARGWYAVDLEDFAALTVAVQEAIPDYVFHLAGLIKGADLATLLQVNVVGTDNLLRAVLAVRPQARILVAGSAAEYGLVRAEDLPVGETTPLCPINAYGVSKVAQSLLAAKYWHVQGLAVVRTRTFNLMGPGEPATQVASAMAQQIAMIEAGLIPSVLQVGNLAAIRDFLDVRDAVPAYWQVARYGEPGRVYNVCSETGIQIRHILETLLAETPAHIEIRETEERRTMGDVPCQIGNLKALRSLCDFEPAIPMQDSLKALLADWRMRIMMVDGCQRNS